MRDEARYRHLTADEQALLAPAELDGRLEVRPGVFLPVPVPMRERAHR